MGGCFEVFRNMMTRGVLLEEDGVDGGGGCAVHVIDSRDWGGILRRM